MSALKWVGGKKQLLKELEQKFPKKIHSFYEPFGGSLTVTLYVLENLECEKIFVSDINSKLVNFYTQVKTDVENVITKTKELIDNDYYENRKLFNATTDKVEQAALFLFLNKSCFNGVYRVNKKGDFNVPIGRNTVNWENNFNNLRLFSEKIKSKKIKIENLNYTDFFKKYKKNMTSNDLVYVDPPYYETFVSYDGYGFSEDDQIRLCELCAESNCQVIASNSNTDFIKKLYAENNFTIEEVDAYRFINRNAKNRDKKPVEILCVKQT